MKIEITGIDDRGIVNFTADGKELRASVGDIIDEHPDDLAIQEALIKKRLEKVAEKKLAKKPVSDALRARLGCAEQEG